MFWFSSLDRDAQASYTRQSASDAAAAPDSDSLRAGRVVKLMSAMETGASGAPTTPEQRRRRAMQEAMEARWVEARPRGDRCWAPRHSVDSIAGRAASRTGEDLSPPPMTPELARLGDPVGLVDVLHPSEGTVTDRGGRGPQLIQPRPSASPWHNPRIDLDCVTPLAVVPCMDSRGRCTAVLEVPLLTPTEGALEALALFARVIGS